MVKRFEVYLCENNQEEKPCIVISPNEMNDTLSYVLIAPITTCEQVYPFRYGVGLKGKKAYIAFDLIQPIDKTALKNKIGILPQQVYGQIIDLLNEMFSK